MTVPNLLTIAETHFHICLIFLIYREKTNTILSSNCFNTSVGKVKWQGKKKTHQEKPQNNNNKKTPNIQNKLFSFLPLHQHVHWDDLEAGQLTGNDCWILCSSHICHYAIISTASFSLLNGREIWSCTCENRSGITS